ncbi:hypothetical protein TRFO_21176 [Tritrichomonas foetus]|uniref:Small GTP-binding protein n=1 Tax=Tritrichomonas foetus TaxID=1144522 RepID=A0A1J4KF00_9EUKA|nr:hypothetical protein TRFO_21176 [Tritrichomonas foetus]|eukprot:OHT09755.1 hypothetical protein TRFO_21176 [Tritrichomonas foetus]
MPREVTRETTLNVLLIGDSCVGKTKLANSLHKKDSEFLHPTLGIDFIQSQQVYQDTVVNLKTWEINIEKVTMLFDLKENLNFDFVFFCSDCQLRKRFNRIKASHNLLSLTICKESRFILMICKTDVLAALAPNEFHHFLISIQKRSGNLNMPCIMSSAETDFFIDETRNMLLDSFVYKNPIKMSILKMVQEFKAKSGLTDP